MKSFYRHFLRPLEKYKIIVLLIQFTFSSSLVYSQLIEWQKCLGGSNSEISYCMKETTDGGYFIVGHTSSNNGDVTSNHGSGLDIWAVKINSTGSIVWQKCLGGSGTEVVHSTSLTNNSGYIISGITSSSDGDVLNNNGGVDCWIVKLNSSGNILWEKNLGGTDLEEANSIIQTTDGGYIFAGYTFSNDVQVSGNHGGKDIWIVKLSSGGNMVWQKCYGGTNDEEAKSIQQTLDGGYIITGYTKSNDGDVSNNFGISDYWIIKISQIGTIEWEQSFGGSNMEEAYSIIQLIDSSYVITGYTYSNDIDVSGNNGSRDIWVIKIQSNGTLEWQKCYGGTNSDGASMIKQTIDEGFLIAGGTLSNDGDVSGNHSSPNNPDAWILKIDSIGLLQWQQCFGGALDDQSTGIEETNNGYIFCGYTNSNDGDVSGNHGDEDFWIAKVSTQLNISQNFNINSSNLIPNPNSGNFTVNYNLSEKNVGTFNIYNAIGKLVYQEKLTQNNGTLNLNLFLATGVYFWEIRDEENKSLKSEKMVIVD